MEDLYQEIIIDHAKSPRNQGRIDGCAHTSEGYNPLCGDEIKLYIELSGETISDAKFEAQGCAISTASASLMTEAVIGKTKAEAEQLFDSFRKALTERKESEIELGLLEALLGVREYPMRVKCATLAWHALHEAIQDDRAMK